MLDALFVLGAALLVTHEFDAVRRREWRVLPLLRAMPEDAAANVFVLLHAPISAATIVLALDPDDGPRLAFQTAMSAFMVAHVGMHYLLRRHPAYGFDTPLSRTLIWAPGIVGMLYLIVLIAGYGA